MQLIDEYLNIPRPGGHCPDLLVRPLQTGQTHGRSARVYEHAEFELRSLIRSANVLFVFVGKQKKRTLPSKACTIISCKYLLPHAFPPFCTQCSNEAHVDLRCECMLDACCSEYDHGWATASTIRSTSQCGVNAVCADELSCKCILIIFRHFRHWV